MHYLFAVFLGLIYTDLVGYFSHKLLHSGKIGFLYRLHMEHHITLYPPHDLRSDIYRSTPQKKILGAGPEWALPIGAIMLLTAGIMAFTLPWWFILTFFAAALTYALIAYSWLHDQLHLNEPKIIDKLLWMPAFIAIRIIWYLAKASVLHDIHHHNMKKNYGIGSYWLDKLLGTYER